MNNLASTDTFTVTFDGKTGKFTVNDDTGNFQINWTHANTDAHVGALLGFNDSTDDTGSSSYTSDYMAKASDHYVNIHSMKLAGLSPLNQYSGSIYNYIDCIPVDNTFGSYIVYEPVNAIWRHNEPVYLDEVDFYFTDEYENILDLNGMDVMIVLDIIRAS